MRGTFGVFRLHDREKRLHAAHGAKLCPYCVDWPTWPPQPISFSNDSFSTSAARACSSISTHKSRRPVSGFCFDASAPVRTPRTCGDVAPTVGSMRLQVHHPLVTDSRRRVLARLDTSTKRGV